LGKPIEKFSKKPAPNSILFLFVLPGIKISLSLKFLKNHV